MHAGYKKIAVLLLVGMVFSGMAQAADKRSKSEIEKLLAPIALYPDPLLAQVLPASTYPLQIVEAARLIKGESDFSKINSQNWDESVKAVARYPDVLQKMNADLEWTENLGQTVLNQEDDVLKGIQTLRKKAKKVGNLKTSPQHLVKESQKNIEILPANPEIVYVPVYDPQVVYVVRPRYVRAPLISYGVGWHVGSWFNLGFYWPSYRVYHVEPYWWRPGWHRPHGHSHRFYDYHRSPRRMHGVPHRARHQHVGHARPSFSDYDFSRGKRHAPRIQSPSRHESHGQRERINRSSREERQIAPSINRNESPQKRGYNRTSPSFGRSNPSSGQRETFQRSPRGKTETRGVHFKKAPHQRR